MVEFWAGLGGLAFSALALGLRCIILSAEADPELRQAKAKYFPNVVNIDFVEQLDPAMLTKVIQRREIAAILVGGGSPCQGNSYLNSRRKGLQDRRSLQPQILSDFIKNTKLVHPTVPVFGFLENVSSCPPEVVKHYTELMGGPPLEIDSADWGYVRRRRLYWVIGAPGWRQPG